MEPLIKASKPVDCLDTDLRWSKVENKRVVSQGTT